MTNCTFCKIYTSKQGIIFYNKHFFAQFDRFPVTPGHAEIITKRHVASLFDLTKQEWKNFKPAATEVINVIEKQILKNYIKD